MYRSTKRKIIQIAIIAGALLFTSLCYFVAGWRGPAVIFIFALFIAGILWGIFYLSKLFGSNQWRNVAILSCWIGLLMAVISFFLMLLDPRSTNFKLSDIFRNAGIVGLVFLVGGFVVTFLNWNVIRALKSPGKRKINHHNGNLE